MKFVVLKRIVLAFGSLTGRFDSVPGTLDQIGELNERIESLKQSVRHAVEQKDYWYDLWYTMSREFQAAQGSLIELVDEYRKKCGDWDGKPYLDGMAQKAFDEKFVNPKQHPAPTSKYKKLKVEVPTRPVTKRKPPAKTRVK